MREIEFREIFANKCHNCGCKNKVHSELFDGNEFVGYSIKCCNCGKYDEYLLDVQNNGRPHRSYRIGKQSCIQPSYCRFYCEKKCKLPKFKDPTKPEVDPVHPCKDINRCPTVETKLLHLPRFL